MRKTFIEGQGPLTLTRQCELLGLNRTGLYYRPSGETPENLELLQRIDEIYTAHPFYGSRRITAVLNREGREINRKRVVRLLRILGLQALVPKRRLSRPGEDARRYPYLLRELAVVRPDQVWCTDITYIRLRQGFVYLVAVMDWFSRYVLSWGLSNSLATAFCLRALEDAFEFGTPEIFNSDQGSQFTSEDFTERLKAEGIRISQDGRGRCFDNIFIERLWRSVKYEEVYLKDYVGVKDARRNLRAYFDFYNSERLHQALEYATPREVYFG